MVLLVQVIKHLFLLIGSLLNGFGHLLLENWEHVGSLGHEDVLVGTAECVAS
jgi:hypothetical protein